MVVDAPGYLGHHAKEEYRRLTTGLFTLFFLVKKGDEIVGWHSSRQMDAHTLYMELTGIYPAHQGKGLYKLILQIVIQRAKDAGFTVIESKHLAGNNAVLVPKMKAGFVIYSFDLNVYYGLMVHLKYFLREQEQDLYHFRTGSKRLSEKYRPYLALWEGDSRPKRS